MATRYPEAPHACLEAPLRHLVPVLLLCARGLLDGGRAGMLHNVVVEEAAALMVPLLGRGYLGRARILALEQADLPM